MTFANAHVLACLWIGNICCAKSTDDTPSYISITSLSVPIGAKPGLAEMDHFWSVAKATSQPAVETCISLHYHGFVSGYSSTKLQGGRVAETATVRR